MRVPTGLWEINMSKSSSNHIEFRNLVKSVEDSMRYSQLPDVELYIFLETLSLRALTI